MNKFEEICRKTQKGVKRYCSKELKELGYAPVSKDGFLFAEGEIPVLLVAHMDTVHEKSVKQVVYDGHIISSPQGIGGDDRCGIYIILEIIKELKCSVLFTEDEEIGCIGASKFLDWYNETACWNYIVEFDRRGSNDCVFYDCDNPEFTKFITSTGFFEEEFGSLSDISYLAPSFGIAAVNLSCGYYSAHTTKEYVNFDEMIAVIEAAKEIIKLPCEQFEYMERTYSYSYGYGYGKYSSYYRGYNICDDEFYEFGEIGNGHQLLTKSEVKQLYHIYYYDCEDFERAVEVWASSQLEAIGAVLSAIPYLTVNDIVEIRSTDDYFMAKQ